MTLNDIYDLKYECFMSHDIADHWEVSGEDIVNQIASLLSDDDVGKFKQIREGMLRSDQGIMFGTMVRYMGNDEERVTLIGKNSSYRLNDAMATDYTTNVNYDDFVSKLKTIEVECPKETMMGESHRIIKYKHQYIHFWRGEGGLVRMCRYGRNNIWIVFPELIRLMPGMVITDEYGMIYPDCMD